MSLVCYRCDQWPCDCADGITLVHGDCLDVLQEELPRFDAVITDPPYGINGSSGTKNTVRRQFLEHDTEEILLSHNLPALRLAMSKAKRAVVTPGVKHPWKYPEPQALGFIYQPASVGLCVWGAVTCQPVLFYGADPRLGKKIGRLVYQCTQPSEVNGHPCSKPIGVAKWMVERGSLEGETILDPFTGAGTTLVAAKQLGRKAIGIEIEEKYCQIAANKLRQGVLL